MILISNSTSTQFNKLFISLDCNTPFNNTKARFFLSYFRLQTRNSSEGKRYGAKCEINFCFLFLAFSHNQTEEDRETYLCRSLPRQIEVAKPRRAPAPAATQHLIFSSIFLSSSRLLPTSLLQIFQGFFRAGLDRDWGSWALECL